MNKRILKNVIRIFFLLIIVIFPSFKFVEAEEIPDEVKFIKEIEQINNENINTSLGISNTDGTQSNNIDKEYYNETDSEVTTPVLKIYKEIEENKLILKYQVLNDYSINVGFNVFKDQNDNTYSFYLLENNLVARGLYKINDYYYAFNQDGKMLFGWQIIDNKKYYFNQDGKMAYGWQIINNKKYYFDINTGEAYIGFKIIDSRTYFFNNNGEKTIGLINNNGILYYFYDGYYLKNGWKTVNNAQYYFNKYGQALKGINTISKKVYYFNISTCKREDGFVNYKGYVWYIKNGTMYKNKWKKTISRNQYYFDKNGHALKGIKKVGKKTYYFNTTSGRREDGLIYYSGNYYYITGGVMYKNTWLQINSKRKYFGANGIAYKNITTTISGTVYNFSSEANVTHGYFTEDGYTYYKDGNGNLATGYRIIYGKNKFFSQEGILMNNMKNVIDVSYAQGYIDWKKVKSTGKVNGVIVKLGYTGFGGTKSLKVDDWFVKNITELKANKIPYGVYYWGFARDKSKAIAEANHVLNIIRAYNVKPTYGVYYDAEIGGAAREDNNDLALTEEEYILAIPAFINTIRAAGYKAGVYSNADAFFGTKKVVYNSTATKRSTYGYLNNSTIKQYPMWVAHYNTKCSSHYGQRCGYSSYYGWQYTSSGKVSGIATNVDMSLWYRT